MNEQTNDFKPYLKKALVLLMAVIMVFTYMPSMAWAAEGVANATQVEWAGAANCNPANNNVVSNAFP